MNHTFGSGKNSSSSKNVNFSKTININDSSYNEIRISDKKVNTEYIQSELKSILILLQHFLYNNSNKPPCFSKNIH
jgi:hypothetical protein